MCINVCFSDCLHSATGSRFTHITWYVWLMDDAVHQEHTSYSTKSRNTKPQLLGVVSRACGRPPPGLRTALALFGGSLWPLAAVSVLQGPVLPRPGLPWASASAGATLLPRGCPARQCCAATCPRPRTPHPWPSSTVFVSLTLSFEAAACVLLPHVPFARAQLLWLNVAHQVRPRSSPGATSMKASPCPA